MYIGSDIRDVDKFGTSLPYTPKEMDAAATLIVMKSGIELVSPFPRLGVSANGFLYFTVKPLLNIFCCFDRQKNVNLHFANNAPPRDRLISHLST